MKKQKVFRKILLIIGVVIVLLIFLFPVYWIACTSFKTETEAFSPDPAWLPSKLRFINYLNAIDSLNFKKYGINSIVITILSTTISLIIGTLAAYGCDRFKSNVSKQLLIWILSTRMFPSVVTAIPIFLLLHRLNLIDTRIPLIIVYASFNISLVTWIMKGYMEEIPCELDDSAMIDGCSRLGVFGRIILPLAMPGLGAAAIFCFIFSWNEYLFALVLTRETARTLPVAIAGFQTPYKIPWNVICAASMMVVTPVIAFSLLISKQFARGLTFGAIK